MAYTHTRSVDPMDIGKALYEAGLLPAETRRIIIDVRVDSPVLVHYECNAQPETLAIVFKELGLDIEGITETLNLSGGPVQSLPPEKV